MLCPPDCNFINIFGFHIYYYGILLAAAVFAGFYTAHKIAVEKYFLLTIIPVIATNLIIFGIIGARIYYCCINWNFYKNNLLEIFAIREGGLSIHGAIIGGAIALFYLAKKNNISFLKLADIFSLGLPVAQAIGRFGNFFNSEAFGLPTNLPWKMFIKEEYRPVEYMDYSYFHPTFLYESILNILIFLVLYYFVLPKYKDNNGIIMSAYLILYSLVRIPIELLRTDCNSFILGLPVPVFVSVILICIGLIVILFKKIIHRDSQ